MRPTKLAPGQYFYSRPNWDGKQLVTVFEQGGKTRIKYHEDTFPGMLEDCPADAIFEPYSPPVIGGVYFYQGRKVIVEQCFSQQALERLQDDAEIFLKTGEETAGGMVEWANEVLAATHPAVNIRDTDKGVGRIVSCTSLTAI